MTTTVALKCTDGVVLAADKRASKGFFVGSKAAQKLFDLDGELGLAIAGMAADAEYLVNVARAERKLIALRRGYPLSVRESAKLISNLAYSGMKNFNPFFAELLVAGNDGAGPQVFSADMSGAISPEAFTSSGSGSPIAYGVLEGGYNPNLAVEGGKALAVKAVTAAMERDPGSGNGIDVLVLPWHLPSAPAPEGS